MRSVMKSRNLNQEVSDLLQAKFLESFLKILKNKQAIAKAVLENESIYITPQDIYLLSKDINQEDIHKNGFYIIEDEQEPQIICYKNGNKERLVVNDLNRLTQIIKQIRIKKSKYQAAFPLTTVGIHEEYNSFIELIHQNPEHAHAMFVRKKLSFTDCENIKLFNVDGSINKNVYDSNSIKINERIYNTKKLFSKDIALSDRELLIIDAAIGIAHNHIFETMKSENIYEILPNLDDID